MGSLMKSGDLVSGSFFPGTYTYPSDLTLPTRQIWITYEEDAVSYWYMGIFLSELEALRHAVNNNLKIKTITPGEIGTQFEDE
jgi:hypothetical protein